MRKFIIGILLLLLPCCLIAKPKKMTRTYAKPIVVRSSSPSFTLRLPANRTTGFAWYLYRYRPQFITPVSMKYVAAKPMKPGAPGMSVWTFRIKSQAFAVPQLIKFAMVYARPFSMRGASKKIFTVVTTRR